MTEEWNDRLGWLDRIECGWKLRMEEGCATLLYSKIVWESSHRFLVRSFRPQIHDDRNDNVPPSSRKLSNRTGFEHATCPLYRLPKYMMRRIPGTCSCQAGLFSIRGPFFKVKLASLQQGWDVRASSSHISRNGWSRWNHKAPNRLIVGSFWD